MKRTLLAVALLAVTGVASAAPSLSWAELSEATPNAIFDPNSGLTYGGTSFVNSISDISLGRLSVVGLGANPALVTYTYLGKEAGFPNNFYSQFSAGGIVFQNTPQTAIGTTVSVVTNSGGLLPFAFEGYTGNYARNAGTWDPNASIGLIAENYTILSGAGAGTYSYILGFNDTYTGHNDWDDMVIGVNIAPIPEPETYAMLLAGLGLMGFVARRRKQTVVAG
jgi:hypothetical protein